MKIWVSKYALSDGIFEGESEGTIRDGMVRVAGQNLYLHGEGREWHRTREAAVSLAEQMRSKKIESLRKQIERLELLKFGELHDPPP